MLALRRFFCIIFALVLLVGMNPLATQASTQPAFQSPPLTVVHHPDAMPLSEPTDGIDCNCTKTGEFANPKAGVIPTWNEDQTSPNGIYSFIWSGTEIKDIIISRGSEIVLSVHDRADDWGFSPDDHRFVYWYVYNGQTHIRLFNLERPLGSALIWWYDQSITAADILFSPKGNYFFLATLTGTNNTSLQLLDALSGVQRYSTQFFFTIIPGGRGNKYGMAKFGFSPDSSDRTFVYGYVNGQTSVAWRMVNLETGTELPNLNIDGISAYWQFSRCGDILGMIEEIDPSHLQASLHKTQNGTLVYGSQQTFSLTTNSLTTNDESQLAIIGGTPNILASNTAQVACPVDPVLDSISLATARIIGGHPVNGTVSLTLPAPAGGAVISLSSNNPAATVPSPVIIPEGSTSMGFTVTTQAVSHFADATITASYKGDNAPILLHVLVVPPPLESMTTNSGVIGAGKTLAVTIALQSVAPEGGVEVVLSSSHSDLVPLPETILIPAGKKSVQIVRGPFQVSTDTKVTLSAYLNGGNKSANVILLPKMPELQALSFDPTSIVGGSSSLVTGTITLAAESPSNYLSVNLTTTYTSTLAFALSVPIGKGKTTSTFYVSTFGGVAEPMMATVTAELDGITRSADIQILPADIERLYIDPSCGVARKVGLPNASISGYPIDAVVQLNGGAPPNGAVIQLASSNPALVPAPPSMTVYANGGSVTIPTGEVDEETIVTLTASYRDVVLQTPITITIVPTYSLTSISLPFSPQFLNDEGQIAGDSSIYHDGEITDLDSIFNGLLGIIDLNENGDVIASGQIEGVDGDYYIEDNQPHLIAPLDGYLDFVPEAMNDQGEVIGRACNSSPSYMCTGFSWKDGVTTGLQYDPTRPVTLPQDINNQGVIVGYSEQKDEYGGWISQMLEWVEKLFIPLDPYPVRSNQAIVINENGTIALHAGEPYTWNNGVLTMVPVPVAHWAYTQVKDLNDREEVLFTALINHDTAQWEDFIHNEHGSYPLRCALDLPEGWDAWGIDLNNDGQILGTKGPIDDGGGLYRSEENTYFIFTPSEMNPPNPSKTKIFIPIIVSK